jgi:hypothetical protein
VDKFKFSVQLSHVVRELHITDHHQSESSAKICGKLCMYHKYPRKCAYSVASHSQRVVRIQSPLLRIRYVKFKKWPKQTGTVHVSDESIVQWTKLSWFVVLRQVHTCYHHHKWIPQEDLSQAMTYEIPIVLITPHIYSLVSASSGGSRISLFNNHINEIPERLSGVTLVHRSPCPTLTIPQTSHFGKLQYLTFAFRNFAFHTFLISRFAPSPSPHHRNSKIIGTYLPEV